MKVNYTGTIKPQDLGSLRSGQAFKYPTGESVYMVCKPSRRYPGKIRFAKLDNGNIYYEESAKPAVKLCAEVNAWSE